MFLSMTLVFVLTPGPEICGIDDVDEGRGARIPLGGIAFVAAFD